MKADPDIQRVGVFGGTFDPVHKGHISIVHSFLRSGLIDAVWVTPTPTPPFKTRKALAAYAHRIAMVELAFKDSKRVIVSDFETRIKGKSYTYKTLNNLREQYTHLSWYLCIGSDNLEVFHKWQNFEELINETGIIVAARPGYKTSNVDKRVLPKVEFVEHDPIDISSTQIRNELKNIGYSDHIIPEVLEYIRDHNLYNLKQS